MSVVKNKRNLSRLEFYSVARQLREDLTRFLIRDFGIRNKIYKEVLEDNTELTTIEGYPEWIVDYLRKSIIVTVNQLMDNIVAANSIYPINMREVEERRILQDRAIMNCEQLLQKLTYCADVLPVSLLKFEPYAVTIDKEIALLKGWRKSTNAISAKIMNKGARVRQ